MPKTTPTPPSASTSPTPTTPTPARSKPPGTSPTSNSIRPTPTVDVVITSDRDGAGFLLWEKASVGGTPDYRNDYEYDGYGRPIAVTQGPVENGNSVEPKRVEFSYTSDSLLAAIDRYLYETDGTLDPVASSSFTYTDGELTGLVHADPLEAILREYDWTYQDGRIATEDSGDGGLMDVMYTYDTDGQLSGVIDLAGTGRSSGYNYDDTGNRTNGNDSNGYAAYTVDDFNRLDRVTVTKDLVVTVYRYDYDAEGNRIRKYTWTDADNDDTVDWNATEISDWTKYTWDHRNRLIQVESGAAFETTDVTVTFAYDYLNRWIATEVDTDPATPGDETGEYFVYGQATLPDEVASWDRAATDARDIGQIALRLNEDGEISNRYLWGAAVDQILADEQVEWTGQAYSTERTLWPLTDHQGTVRDLAKVNGSGDTEIADHSDYDAYGHLLAETDPTVDHLFGFTGRANRTGTDLQDRLHRVYDAAIGRFASEDPIVFRGGDANLSRYCGNDRPARRTIDSSGILGRVSVLKPGRDSDGDGER